MGFERFVGAMDDSELTGLLESARAEAQRRQLEVAPAAGSAAMPETVARPDRLPEPEIEGLAEFLNPDFWMSPTNQFAVVGNFWALLDREMPGPANNEQAQRIGSILAEHPQFRIVPTPLLDIYERLDMVQRARAAFDRNQFDPGCEEGLALPDPNRDYGWLLRSLSSFTRDDGERMQLGNKLHSGEIVSHAVFVDDLLEQGKAVRGSDGRPWVYPVLDVRANLPDPRRTARDLFKDLEPTILPETLLALQLLYQANGVPPTMDDNEIANEVVYGVNAKGQQLEPEIVAAVSWRSPLPAHQRQLGRRAHFIEWEGMELPYIQSCHVRRQGVSGL